MKKAFIFVIVLAIIVAIGVTVVRDLLNDGYAYYGDVWQDTPEKALAKEADMTAETLQTLTPKTILQTKRIDDIVEMTFVSIGDTLVSVTFVTNDKGQYCVYGYTEEVWLDDPRSFLMNGDPEQIIMSGYDHYNTTVFGWCYSSASFTVNGMVPSTQTYEFECQSKTWSINYWWIDDVPQDTEVSIEYVGH